MSAAAQIFIVPETGSARSISGRAGLSNPARRLARRLVRAGQMAQALLPFVSRPGRAATLATRQANDLQAVNPPIAGVFP